MVSSKAILKVQEAELIIAVQRHQSGDWGDVSLGDQEMNERALQLGSQFLLSVYRTADEIKFWIITELQNHTTKVLLPCEYYAAPFR